LVIVSADLIYLLQLKLWLDSSLNYDKVRVETEDPNSGILTMVRLLLR